MKLKRLLIIYHSQSGAAGKLAQAVASGASAETSIEFRLCMALAAGLTELLWADGLIVVTPENFGSMSGAVKDFFDRTFYPAQKYKINIPYMIVVSAGNDGSGAVSQLQRICKGYPMKQVGEPVIIRGKPDVEDIEMAVELGQAMATGLAIGIF